MWTGNTKLRFIFSNTVILVICLAVPKHEDSITVDSVVDEGPAPDINIRIYYGVFMFISLSFIYK